MAAQFSVPVFNVDSLSLPDTLQYEVTGYLLDQAGNCAAAVSDEAQQLECGNRGGAIVAEGRLGQRLNRPRWNLAYRHRCRTTTHRR